MTHPSGPDAEGRNPTAGRDGRHRSLIVAAESRRLQRQLLAFGPMHRDRLAHTCGADRWREGTFEEAVLEGVRTGLLRQLPMGWLTAERPAGA
jgi:hypothetical protein